MEMQRIQSSQNILKKQTGRLSLPEFKTYKVMITIIVWYWFKDIQQINETEKNPETEINIYSEY